MSVAYGQRVLLSAQPSPEGTTRPRLPPSGNDWAIAGARINVSDPAAGLTWR